MRVGIFLAVVLITIFYDTHAADRGPVNLPIARIRHLALPDNFKELLDQLNSPEELSQTTKNKILEVAVNVENFEALEPLFKAGAKAEYRWVIDALNAYFDIHQIPTTMSEHYSRELYREFSRGPLHLPKSPDEIRISKNEAEVQNQKLKKYIEIKKIVDHYLKPQPRKK